MKNEYFLSIFKNKEKKFPRFPIAKSSTKYAWSSQYRTLTDKVYSNTNRILFIIIIIKYEQGKKLNNKALARIQKRKK